MTLQALWKYRAHIALISIAVIGFLWLQRFEASIRQDEQQKCQYAAAIAVNEGRNRHDQKKIELRALDNDALVRRYCRWVYDVPYDICIRTARPVDQEPADAR